MPDVCTRCGREPAVQGSELGVRCLWPEPHELAAYVAAPDPASPQCAPATFERDPRGCQDPRPCPSPPAPCCRRIGASWCYLPDDEHPVEQCRAVAARPLAVNLLDHGRSR